MQNPSWYRTKPAFSFWINISTVSELRCDSQGLGLVARIEASNLVFDTKQDLHWLVLGQIQFWCFDRRCKTCLDTKPVLSQGRFCSLTRINQRKCATPWLDWVPHYFECIWTIFASLLNSITVTQSCVVAVIIWAEYRNISSFCWTISAYDS